MSELSYMSDTSQGNGENIEEGKLTKRSFLARAETLGSAEGRGDNSRPGLFVLACEAARHRVITEDDCEEVFDRYSKKVAAAQGIGWKPQASQKQQVSKLRTAIKLGLLPQVNGLEVCNEVIAAQKEQRIANEGKNDYPPFDGLVKVARFQLRDPDKQLPREVIDGLLIKPAGDTPEEADRLEKVMKQLTGLADKKEEPVSPESVDALQEAASVIMTRIRELGGSTSMRKQAEKAQNAAKQAVALVDLSRERAAKAAAALQPDPKLVAYLAERRAAMGDAAAE